MRHKRKRPRFQRAGCRCGCKAAKVFGTRNRKGMRPRDTNGRAQALRQAVTAWEQGA